MRVFSGETSDVTTVEKVKADLRGWRLGRCVFVGDAGMNSEENRRTLTLGDGKYILASKTRVGESGLRMRPVFHHRPWRIQAHVSISVLSLLLERIAELRAGDTWRNICAGLESIKVVEYERVAALARPAGLRKVP